MKYIIIFIATNLLLICNIYAKSEPESSRSRSLGNCGVSTSDYWAIINNEAGMVWNNSSSIGIITENRFLLKELNNYTLAVTLPLKKSAFGASLNYFGFDLYNEKSIQLSYAMKLSKNFSVGVGLEYLHFSQAELYQSLQYINFSMGVMMHITNKLTLASHIYNPLMLNNDVIPTLFRLGGTYQFSPQFTSFFELERNTSTKTLYKAGLEYSPITILRCRLGIISHPSTVCFGLGINLKQLDLDISSQMHPILGLSQQISLLIPLK
ncbi:MAG: hypothetical protein JEZ03_15005 [Bacteroidales bacterium]|nr:hypothetical protein [Bacteroidales bacterium]